MIQAKTDLMCEYSNSEDYPTFQSLKSIHHYILYITPKHIQWSSCTTQSTSQDPGREGGEGNLYTAT